MPNIQFQLRRGTAATWTSTNPILADGELGFETDTRQLKVGNDTSWNLIPYLNIGQAANWSAFPAYQTVDFSSNVISNASRVINGAGSVSAPSYTFFNDLSMGLYDPSTNTLGFVTSGAERMRIDANGNVGINTNNPLYRLDIRFANVVNRDLRITGGTGNLTDSGGAISFSAGQGSATADGCMSRIKGVLENAGTGVSDEQGGIAFLTRPAPNSNLAEAMRINGAGNVGIGTTNPQYRFDILNTGVTDTSQNIDLIVRGGGNNNSFNGGSIGFANINDATYRPHAAIKGLLYSFSGSNENGGLGFYTRQPNDAFLTERIRITDIGRVGIGTTDVANLLTVRRDEAYSNRAATIIPSQLSLESVTGKLKLGVFYTGGVGVASTIQSLDFFSSQDNPAHLLLNPRGGNVGIGTNNPADSRLEVIVSSATDNNVFKLGETNNNLRMTAGSSYGAIRYTDGAGTTRGGGMYFNSNGVGIGETSPPHRFTVVGNVHVSNAANQIMGLFSPNYGQYLHIGAWNTSGSVSSNIVLNQFGGTVGIRTNSLDSAYSLHVRSANNNGMIRADNSFGQFVLAVYNDVQSWTDWGSTSSILYVGSTQNTDRSINTGGSVNTYGTDYAEYMFKDQTDGQFTIQKGDIAGVTSNGLLTNTYDSAVTFVVKSTKPSFVGGDAWSRKEIIGEKPTKPSEQASQEEKDAYVTALTEWETLYEAERQKVDRIAFSGQVPVNISNATPGDYIVPVRTENGGISAVAVSDSSITFDQYRKAVGKVIKNLGEGKSLIIVKMP